jgi:signal transduction histidine kinase
MLYDETYHRAKVAVMTPIRDFLRLVDRRTRLDVQAAEDRATSFRHLFAAVGLGLLFVLWRTYVALRDTLGGSLDEVHGHIAKLGRGDFTAGSQPGRGLANSVLGWLFETRARLHDADRARREAEESLRRSNEALLHSNRELEQFAYVASHDLQEPLRMVSSYTQLLEKRYGDALDQDAKDFIRYAVDGANRMQRLIQDLLQYSRITTCGRPLAPLDAHNALGGAVANLQAAILETGALVTHEKLPLVLADPTQLVQLFQNLIGNGIKFHRPGTPPRVHVSVEDRADQPELQARAGGPGLENPGFKIGLAPGELQTPVRSPNPAAAGQPGWWTFKVTDNGLGIESEYFERLFVIFQRLHTRQEYPGTGIGLALCKRIVERHGGKLWLTSEAGTGSTFFFTLPSAERGTGAQP